MNILFLARIHINGSIVVIGEWNLDYDHTILIYGPVKLHINIGSYKHTHNRGAIVAENGHSQQGGIGFVGLLTICFIVLKLTNYINWSWVWVLSPLWITSIFVVVLLLIIVGIAVFTSN